MGQPPGRRGALADPGAKLGTFGFGEDDGLFGVAHAGSLPEIRSMRPSLPAFYP